MYRSKIFLALLLVVTAIFTVNMLNGKTQKVVLITGAGSGIGLATVKAFQEKEWKVWAGWHRKLSDELKGIKNIRICQLDVTNDDHIQSAIANILKEEGRIDALVNNAGYGLIGAEECVTIKEAQQLFDVNFFGALRLIQAVLLTMKKQNSGHILTISSGVGVHSFPGLGLYSSSKLALESMSESLSATVWPWSVNVSIIEPGFVKNDWGKHCVTGSRPCDGKFYEKLTQGIQNLLSMKPGAQPCDEIAALLVKIAEDPNPDMRYQTSPSMEAYIAERLLDPTGNLARDNNREFAST